MLTLLSESCSIWCLCCGSLASDFAVGVLLRLVTLLSEYCSAGDFAIGVLLRLVTLLSESVGDCAIRVLLSLVTLLSESCSVGFMTFGIFPRSLAQFGDFTFGVLLSLMIFLLLESYSVGFGEFNFRVYSRSRAQIVPLLSESLSDGDFTVGVLRSLKTLLSESCSV